MPEGPGFDELMADVALDGNRRITGAFRKKFMVRTAILRTDGTLVASGRAVTKPDDYLALLDQAKERR